MSAPQPVIPALELRFLPPPGWRWHSFTRNGRMIRFGSVFPQDSIPDAVVVCLGGLSEFAEKYYELAADLNARNLAFWTMDWMGQGKSGRYLDNPHKRHSDGFAHDVDDLHYFIMEYIKHSSVHPDKGRIPMALLGHSMGAHLGLRFLAEHPGLFECAAFSAPFLGIHGLGVVPAPLLLCAAECMKSVKGKSYAPGQGDWSPDLRDNPQNDIFSGDPVRAAVHNAWCLADPALQVGGVTWGWIYEALLSCKKLNHILHTIQTPCLLGIAQREQIVDNSKIRQAARKLPHAQILEMPGACHEILMERDEIRNPFIESFYQLIKETIIDKPETLKPF